MTAAGERQVPRGPKAAVAAADPRRGRALEGRLPRAPTTVEAGIMSGEACYDLFQSGSELLEARRLHGRRDPARARARARAGQELDPRGARARVLPLRPLRAGGRGVRGGRRALPGERLRPLLPRPLAREDRPRRPRRAATRRWPPACAPTARLPGVSATGCGPPERRSSSSPWLAADSCLGGLDCEQHARQPALATAAPGTGSRTATAASTTSPSRRSSARSSTAATGRSAWTHISRERVHGEPHQPRLAVPPEQHPGSSSAPAASAGALDAHELVGDPKTPMSSGSSRAASAETVSPHSAWARRRHPPGRARR